MEEGAGVPGAAMGPAALRTAGLAARLADLGHVVEDLGDTVPRAAKGAAQADRPGNMRNFARVAAWTRLVSAHALEIMNAGTLPIFMGGDHALSMGSVNGVATHASEHGRELFVLWLDAHADYNTPLTSPSGNMHGMPVAALCGETGLEEVYGDTPRIAVDPANVHLFGIRSIDGGERRLLAERGIDVVDMRRIDEFGVARTLQAILDHVRTRNGLLHVSLDVDFIDPALAPGVGTLVPGGATYREAHLIMEMLHESGLVSSLDIVELNPFLDDRGKSAILLVDLVASLFGRKIFDRPSPRLSEIPELPDEKSFGPTEEAHP
jgi:arginase